MMHNKKYTGDGSQVSLLAPRVALVSEARNVVKSRDPRQPASGAHDKAYGHAQARRA